MFSQSLIDEIIKSWKETGGKVKSAISDEHIRILFETVFFTSLKKEEGVHIKVRVGLLRREEIQDVSLETGNFITVFKKAYPLLFEHYQKLRWHLILKQH